MQAIGLIAGNGYTKAAAAGRLITFPSVAAPAVAADFETTLGAGRHAVALDGAQGSWLVGETALTFAANRLVSILDRARYRSPAFIALVRHALANVVRADAGPLDIWTGMPPAWYPDTAARADLEAAIVAAAAPWGAVTVKVVPEVASVFYAYVFNEAGVVQLDHLSGAVGVIDCGYRDAGVGWFDNGRYITGDSAPGGAHESLREIKRLIAATYGMELPLHEVDAAVCAGGVMVDGERAPLPEGTQAAQLRNLDAIVGTAQSLWPNGGKGLRAVLLGGGGAHTYAEALTATFGRKVLTLPRPQTIGAQGLALAAAAQAARKVAA